MVSRKKTKQSKKSDAKRNNTTRKSAQKRNLKKMHVGKITADWCGHCKQLIPEWNKMKKMMKKGKMNKWDFKFSEIGDTEKNRAKNLTVDSQLQQLNLDHFPNGEHIVAVDGGFPTLFKICGSDMEYYTGQRTAKDMFSWFTRECEKTQVDQPVDKFQF